MLWNHQKADIEIYKEGYNLNLFHLSCLPIWQHKQGPCHMTYRVPVRLSWNINSGLVSLHIYFFWWWVDSLFLWWLWVERRRSVSGVALAGVIAFNHSLSQYKSPSHSASVLLFCIHNNTTCWYLCIITPLSIFTQDAAHSVHHITCHHMLGS